MSDVTAIDLPALRLERLRFDAVAEQPIRLPAFSGSAWRGLIGRSLRRTVCVTRQPVCDGCLLRPQCVYSVFFESPPASEATARRYNALPHPFVLEPDLDGRRAIAPGEPLGLGITLIGRAAELLPYLVHTLQRAGERGLGREGGRFRLAGVRHERAPGSGHWVPVYDAAAGVLQALEPAPAAPVRCPQPLRLRLQTPLRLKRRGCFVGAHQLTPADLLGTLATRVALLAELYHPGSATLARERVNAAIDSLTIGERDLHWYEWTRWSSRQQTHMRFGGLLGRLTLEGPGLEALWPLIRLGQWLHVGKATSFGLGAYRIVQHGDEPDAGPAQ